MTEADCDWAGRQARVVISGAGRESSEARKAKTRKPTTMLETRRKDRHREDRDLALAASGLEIGATVWYWYRHQDKAPRWVIGTVTGAGSKDGYPVIDVALTDPTLPSHYHGFVKWGYGWAVRPWSDERPGAPEPEEMYP